MFNKYKKRIEELERENEKLRQVQKFIDENYTIDMINDMEIELKNLKTFKKRLLDKMDELKDKSQLKKFDITNINIGRHPYNGTIYYDYNFEIEINDNIDDTKVFEYIKNRMKGEDKDVFN